MITFSDGTTLTFEEAARLIEKEGKLITGRLFESSTGLRCLLGVLVDITTAIPSDEATDAAYALESQDFDNTHEEYINSGRHFVDAVYEENDNFEGTPEQRAVYMAQWFRDLEEKE